MVKGLLKNLETEACITEYLLRTTGQFERVAYFSPTMGYAVTTRPENPRDPSQHKFEGSKCSGGHVSGVQVAHKSVLTPETENSGIP